MTHPTMSQLTKGVKDLLTSRINPESFNHIRGINNYQGRIIVNYISLYLIKRPKLILYKKLIG